MNLSLFLYVIGLILLMVGVSAMIEELTINVILGVSIALIIGGLGLLIGSYCFRKL